MKKCILVWQVPVIEGEPYNPVEYAVHVRKAKKFAEALNRYFAEKNMDYNCVLNGHHQPRGVVMAGRDVDHVGPCALQCRHRQAPAVQRDVGHLRLIAAVDAGDLAVARVLHGVTLVPPQQLHQHAVQQLRAGADDDLARVHRHAPKLPEIGGDGATQLRRALRRHGVQQARPLLQNGLAHQPRPHGEGEILRRDGIGHKVHLPARLRQRRKLSRCLLSRQRPLHGADVVAPLFPAADVPLRHQLLVGVFYRAFWKSGSCG